MTNLASPQMVTAGWLVLGVLMAVILAIVIRGARATRSVSDFALGSLAFSPWAVGLALSASMTSAATFIINPGFIALYGVSGVVSYAVVLPVASMASLVVLTKGFRRHGASVKALTLAQWMGTRWGSPAYALFFAVLSLLLVTFIVLIVVGLTKVLSATLAAPELAVMLGVIVFVFGYMMFGGANSMVYTNTVQAILMLIVAFVLLGSGHEHFAAGSTASWGGSRRWTRPWPACRTRAASCSVTGSRSASRSWWWAWRSSASRTSSPRACC